MASEHEQVVGVIGRVIRASTLSLGGSDMEALDELTSAGDDLGEVACAVFGLWMALLKAHREPEETLRRIALRLAETEVS